MAREHDPQFMYKFDAIHEALYWFRKAVEQGSRRALVNLANLNSRAGWANTKEGNPDYKLALSLYHRAVKLGLAEGMFGLGEMYLTGRGVVTDNMQAFLWYQQAAKQGNSQAQESLGWMYTWNCPCEEFKIATNYAQAVFWTRKSAMQGDSEAQARLGDMYESGTGVKQDYVQAMKWYRAAGIQLNRNSREKLVRIEESLSKKSK